MRHITSKPDVVASSQVPELPHAPAMLQQAGQPRDSGDCDRAAAKALSSPLGDWKTAKTQVMNTVWSE